MKIQSKFKVQGQGLVVLFFVCVFVKVEGAWSLWHFSVQISLIPRQFLGTFAEMGPLHCTALGRCKNWLQRSHEGKWWWPPRGSSFVLTLSNANLHHFAPLFGNIGRDGTVHWMKDNFVLGQIWVVDFPFVWHFLSCWVIITN